MEGLLPVIIALILSAIFSRRKQKGQPEDSPFPQEEPPWEDLLRELQSREESSTPASASATPSEQSAEKVVPEVHADQTLEEIPDAEPVSLESSSAEEPLSSTLEPIAGTAVCEKEENVSRAASVISEPVASDFDSRVVPSENAFQTLTLQEVQAVSHPQPTSEQADKEDDSPFVTGFDPRMAVLYSEILRPKYQD